MGESMTSRPRPMESSSVCQCQLLESVANMGRKQQSLLMMQNAASRIVGKLFACMPFQYVLLHARPLSQLFKADLPQRRRMTGVAVVQCTVICHPFCTYT